MLSSAVRVHRLAMFVRLVVARVGASCLTHNIEYESANLRSSPRAAASFPMAVTPTSITPPPHLANDTVSPRIGGSCWRPIDVRVRRQIVLEGRERLAFAATAAACKLAQGCYTLVPVGLITGPASSAGIDLCLVFTPRGH